MMLNKLIPSIFREEVTSKVLFLSLIFIASFWVLFAVDHIHQRTTAQYEDMEQNQQARSQLGKAILHRLLMAEVELHKITDATDSRSLDITLDGIYANLNNISTILDVLQHGGTFTNSLPANFYEMDVVDEKIRFTKEAGEGYVLEAIDLNPKIIEMREAIGEIAKDKKALLSADPTHPLTAIQTSLHIKTMKVEALILRARESASKIFYDTQREIQRLETLKEEASDNIDAIRIGILGFTIAACILIFLRILFSIRAILHDRENKTQNLNEAKQAIEAIMDSIPVGLIIVNEDKKILQTNAEAVRLFEAVSPEEIVGQRCDNLFCLSSEDQCPLQTAIGPNHVAEISIKTLDQREITVLKNATYITLSGERLILEAFMDISERKRIERRLKEQQQYTNAILQGVQAGVVVIHADSHTIVDMNESAARLIGINREDALGVQCHKYICPAEVGRCPVTDLGQQVDHAVRTLANGKAVLKSVVSLQREDDLYLLENFVEISEQVEVEKQLKHALGIAAEANQAKSDFLSRMSHELRTPLNAIIGFSDLLLSGNTPPLTEKRAEQVEHIRSAGHHLLQMISEVLDFTRAESGNMSVCVEPTAVDEVIRECLALMEQQADAAGVTLALEEGIAQLPLLLVDRMRFKQIILNLLSNAIKYNKQGGTVVVTGSCDAKGMARVTVTDTGIGIAEDRIGDLFKPFSRLVDEKSEIEGTGVGMAITKQLVELMGGTISVTSVHGEGSIFEMDLPATESFMTSDQTGIMEGLDTTEVSIVYIDNDPETIAEVRDVLREWNGSTTIVRKTMEKGIQAATLLSPNAILINRDTMGTIDEETIATIKSGSKNGSPPFLAVIDQEENNGQPDIASGIDACFGMPLDLGKLILAFKDFREQTK